MGTEEKIAAHFKPYALALTEVVTVSIIHIVGSFGCFQVDIVHLGVFRHFIPIDASLMVAYVNAMQLPARNGTMIPPTTCKGWHIQWHGMTVGTRLACHRVWLKVGHQLGACLCFLLLVTFFSPSRCENSRDGNGQQYIYVRAINVAHVLVVNFEYKITSFRPILQQKWRVLTFLMDFNTKKGTYIANNN